MTIEREKPTENLLCRSETSLSIRFSSRTTSVLVLPRKSALKRAPMLLSKWVPEVKHLERQPDKDLMNDISNKIASMD